MSKLQGAARFLFYGVWAVLMTALTYILGAATLKVLRRNAGRTVYWGLTTILSMGLYALQFKMLAVAYFSLVVLMGVFSELEELGLGFNLSTFFTLVINSLVGAGAFAFWAYSTGPKWSATVLNTVEAVLKPLESYNPGLEMKYFDVMLQLPSVILLMWMASIYLSTLLESRFVKVVTEIPNMRNQLMEFRVPHIGVWVFILALLGKFSGHNYQAIEALSANALNVCFMLFFFQGIAVVGRFFEKLRLGLFWQTLFMILIVVYLFLFVSILGLMDYWFDFRTRLAKRTEEFERET